MTATMSSYGMSRLMNFISPEQFMMDSNQHSLLLHENFNLDQTQAFNQQESISRSESIHSGHFMVSQLDDTETLVGEEEQAIPDIDTIDNEQNTAVTAACAVETIVNECSNTIDTNEQLFSYVKNSHKIIIDASLSKLFRCMTLAYDGKLTSPKWKTFKGLKLKLKDKIRLNNIIWRAWHIQYIICRKPPVCQFMLPNDCDSHKKPEAVVLEGKYWKRRFTTVTAEYKKWRLYFKERTSNFNLTSNSQNMGLIEPLPDSNSSSDIVKLDEFVMDFSDSTLFNSLLPPSCIDFISPREITRSGLSSDFIQPGLTQLQPSFDDDYMDFDFLLSRNSILPTLPEEPIQETTKSSKTMSGYFMNSSLSAASTSNDFSLATEAVQMRNINNNKLRNNNLIEVDNGSCSNNNNSNNNNANKNIFIKTDNTRHISSAIRKHTNQSSCSDINSESHLSSSNCRQTTNNVPLAAPNSGYHEIPQANFEYLTYKSSFNESDSNNERTLSSDFNLTGSTVTTSNSMENFLSPKSLRQRTRSRSVSSPIDNLVQIQQSTLPTASLNNISGKITAQENAIERSSSIPLVSTNQRRITIGPTFNAYLQQQQQSQQQLQSHIQTSNPNLSIALIGNLENYSNDSLCMLNSSTSKPQTQQPVNHSDTTSIIVQLLSNNNNNNTANITGQSSTSHPYKDRSDIAHKQVESNYKMKRKTDTSASRRTSLERVNNKLRLSNSNIATAAVASSQSQTMATEDLFSSSTSNTKIETSATINSVIPTSSLPPPPPPKKLSPMLPFLPSNFIVPHFSQDSANSTPLASPTSLSPSFSASTNASSVRNLKQKTEREKLQYKEHRRVCHINAEQKRRCNIKNGFDTLRTILPSVNQSTNTKISKAAMLQKAAEHIKNLKLERQQQQEEYELLKKEIDNLNTTISVFQGQLPATGAPITCQRTGVIKERFDAYVEKRVNENWKFWIFSIIMKPLLESYDNTVTTNNFDNMLQSILRWLDQNCSLLTLRPNAIGALRYLSTSTNVLTNPATLPEEAVKAVMKKERKKSN